MIRAHRVFIGVGSNIRPESSIDKALDLLSREVRISRISTFYLTEPADRPEQPSFYNGVLEAWTKLSPRELKYSVLRAIERTLDRIRTEDRYAPRTIDLDILLYEDEMYEEEGLEIPDPQIASRAFLALPLAEVAPEVTLPGTDLTIQSIAESFDKIGMMPLEEFTRRMKLRFEIQSP